MHRKLLGLALMVGLILTFGAAKARAQGQYQGQYPGQYPGQNMDINYFYDALAPYGEWINLAPYGLVFCPYNTGIGWRPYVDGDWVDSDYGWTFDSDEPWAWACYHYGRWAYDPRCGSIWIPGSVWGPAWVAWRFGGGFCGWAPLPPQVGFGFGIGLELGGFDLDDIGWNNWCFVGEDWFGRRGMRGHIFDRDRNLEFFRETRNVTNYSFEGNRIINRGIDPREVERFSHRTLEHYQIADAAISGNHIDRLRGNTLEMFRPNIKEGKMDIVPKNVVPKHVQVPPETLLQRHALENQNLDQHYQQSLNEMNLRHQRELSNPPKGINQQDLIMMHQKEVQSLQTQHQYDKTVIDNKHHREQTMNSEYHQSSSQTQGGGGKKKK